MKRFALFGLSVLTFLSVGCGLINGDGDITITPGIPVSFTIDANELCPSSADCSQEQAASPATRELAPIETDVNVDVVEATGNQQLETYAGSFKSIEIVSIEYNIKGNDLTFDLPESDLYIGPTAAEKKDDSGVAKLATIPTVAAGSNPSGTATVSAQGRSVSSEQLRQLEMSAILAATPKVEEGQPFPPSGSADIELTINVEFVANPIDN